MTGRERDFDLVLFGATGFTGALTARYLAGHVPPGCRWALAGRNRGKLEAVRSGLAADRPDRPELADLPLLIADVTDEPSLRAVAAGSRVVISTVGPYVHFGEPLVAACAAEGTDYLDLTGEPEFVDLMYARHHAQAQRTGARLIHCCGFDSIPHDLGVLFTVEQLPPDVAIRVDGVVRAGGTPSGGTLHSAITAFGRLRASARAAKARRQLEPPVEDRSARAVNAPPRRADGFWLLPLPTIDPQIVARSARALPRYGPDFRYRHYAGVRRLPVAAGASLAMAGLVAVSQLPPARSLLLGRIEAGSGPSEQRRAASWFEVRFTGTGGGRRVVTRVSGGDPGYDETAKMLAEAALCIAFDELPTVSGQVTTAQAMGAQLIKRLQAAGIRFEVLSESSAAG